LAAPRAFAVRTRGFWRIMTKLSKADLNKFKTILLKHRAVLTGEVEDMRQEALQASGQDVSVDHMADHGSDNYDQEFTLSLIENEQTTLRLIDEALARIEGKGEWEFGHCEACVEEPQKLCRSCPQIPKTRLDYLPWARNCVEIQKAREDLGG
jgi:RNA polymerase-binding transcription factor DksA